jgi:outer membrane protein OmpA-like peptidoglycan-associated protein
MRMFSQTLLRCFVGLGACAAMAGCAHQPGQTAEAQPAPPPLASKPTVGQEIGAVVQNKVQVTFPEGGYQLTPDADRQLDLAARLFRDVNPVVMFTMGYTDTKGDEFNNVLLSARRARAVKQGLIARGVPADRLRIQAFGESELADPADPLAEENRRVVIMWRLL